MEHHFWHQRWAAGQLGFHQQNFNSRLIKFCDSLGLDKGEKIFVPLCGKSLDMLWLSHVGYEVLGNEISDIACRDFFVDNQLKFKQTDEPPFIKFSIDHIELLCGDFFALTADNLAGVRAVYDRAALIAFPESMRPAYASHLGSILQPDCQTLLISMDYDENKMTGPPFSVAQEEVMELFETEFSIKVINQSSGPEIVGHLASRGLDTLNETVYLLQRLG